MEESLPSGKIISHRYTLRFALGHGAFGTSYLAEDPLNRRLVVIKLLNPGESMGALFQREVSIARSLSHPNILNVLDLGSSEDGRPYYVTEWVEGKDLAAILRSSGPLGIDRSLQVATGVAEALAYVHSQGFVHRDLKPSNIVIPGWPSAPDYRNPKILDFGVAGLLLNGQTRAGMVFGTPRYMSPEQVLGESQSPATDVYGWGLLLFEMLAGHALWRAIDKPEFLFSAILNEEFPEHEFEAIPADCAILIRRCLRRNTSERPAIATVLENLRCLEKIKASLETASPDIRFAGSERVAVPFPLEESRADLTTTSYAAPGRRQLNWFAIWGHNRLIWLALLGSVCLVSVLAFVPFRRITITGSLVMVGGILWMGASIAVGFWLRGWLGRNSSAKTQAYELAAGAKSRVDLTATIAVQLDDLIYSLRSINAY